ncbi:hypothetical protein [Gimibacter soli]|uniref:Lipoprotein n=1 Tax=Gimibacter soli TaxID=3024400 RepID=A0AAE9XSG7_9PROT|nr:hypothetical protein [Gimibacter soli]WCL54291.1 hypothetical protein PH603_00775 [Gimibacter soli]
MILRPPAPLIPALAAAFLVAGCAGQADWPSLTDPLPDAAARTTPYKDPNARPREVAPPTASDEAVDAMPESAEEAASRFAEVEAAYGAALKAYADVRDSIGTAPDKDVAGDRWREAQLLLTRASFVRERLIPLTGLSEAAAALYAASDKLVATERQKLKALTP